MSSVSQYNPTGRFSGRAKLYAQYRPDYPAQAVDYLIATAQLGFTSLVIDVGCGTGISSRQLAQRGIPVIGMEPNDEMRAKAQAESTPEGCPAPEYRAGQAENTGLPNSCADMVLAAQAFHWFEREAALKEFHRLLKPSGWAVLMWNERDETDPFTGLLTQLIRSAPHVAKLEKDRADAGDLILTHPLFENAHKVTFSHSQTLDEEGLRGRCFSASYAPKEHEEAEKLVAALCEAFRKVQTEGRVVLRYVTTVFCGQRREIAIE